MCGIFSISCGEPRLRWKKLLLPEIVARQGNLDDRITVTVHLIPAPLAALLHLLRPHIPRARWHPLSPFFEYTLRGVAGG